ncbi:MAG: TIGR03862 family flavoprotein [Flavobacteriales bacterium]
MAKQSIAIIGGGSAALMFACEVDTQKYDVTIYERNQGLGRKFLVAGKGGFNLTHGSEMDAMKEKYIASTPILDSLDSFTNEDFRTWLEQEGIETYVGSSKRIFPLKNTKPIKVLKAFEDKLIANGVTINYNHTWRGFAEKGLKFETPEGEIIINPDKTIFALGGASWKITGSDGSWLSHFEEKGIKTKPFFASNCGVEIKWKEKFAKTNEGLPLKSIAISCGDLYKKGDLIVTRKGLEGSAIYAMSPAIRAELEEFGEATVYLDLKPTTTEESILRKMHSPKKKNSWSEHLIWQLKFSKTMFDLVKRSCDKEEFINSHFLAKHIKNFPIKVIGLEEIDKAISTVGGIELIEINDNFELKNLPNHYVIGEMLDWDAPTGGYLLQGCMSMGKKLAKLI